MPVSETLSEKRRRAVNTSWENTTDRTARTTNGRKAADKCFEAQVDPDGAITPEARAKAASEARTAVYAAIGAKGRATQRAKWEAQGK